MNTVYGPVSSWCLGSLSAGGLIKLLKYGVILIISMFGCRKEPLNNFVIYHIKETLKCRDSIEDGATDAEEAE